MMKKHIQESYNHYNSPKLVQILKQHGRPTYNDADLNYFLTFLTDDQVYGVTNEDSDDAIPLSDGTFLLVNGRGTPYAKYWHGNASALRDFKPYNDKLDRPLGGKRDYNWHSYNAQTAFDSLKTRNKLNQQLPKGQQIRRSLTDNHRLMIQRDHGKISDADYERKMGTNRPSQRPWIDIEKDNEELEKRIANNKQKISESKLRRIIKESIIDILNDRF